ncbi:hypothetical protein J6590_049184 [Homalodisca vitripennis]|nr:hypothetical protein J6590_049184 [Homalodisca vitripennis]
MVGKAEPTTKMEGGTCYDGIRGRGKSSSRPTVIAGREEEEGERRFARNPASQRRGLGDIPARLTTCFPPKFIKLISHTKFVVKTSKNQEHLLPFFAITLSAKTAITVQNVDYRYPHDPGAGSHLGALQYGMGFLSFQTKKSSLTQLGDEILKVSYEPPTNGWVAEVLTSTGSLNGHSSKQQPRSTLLDSDLQSIGSYGLCVVAKSVGVINYVSVIRLIPYIPVPKLDLTWKYLYRFNIVELNIQRIHRSQLLSESLDVCLATSRLRGGKGGVKGSLLSLFTPLS